jgi:hypothetical protein
MRLVFHMRKYILLAAAVCWDNVAASYKSHSQLLREKANTPRVYRSEIEAYTTACKLQTKGDRGEITEVKALGLQASGETVLECHQSFGEKHPTWHLRGTEETFEAVAFVQELEDGRVLMALSLD